MIFFPPKNQECLEFFNIPEARSAHYFLMDKRWNLIHYSKVHTLHLSRCRRRSHRPPHFHHQMTVSYKGSAFVQTFTELDVCQKRSFRICMTVFFQIIRNKINVIFFCTTFIIFCHNISCFFWQNIFHIYNLF